MKNSSKKFTCSICCSICCLIFGCKNNDSSDTIFENSTSLPDENINPTTGEIGNECSNNYDCLNEEICFKGVCNYFGSLIYDVKVNKFDDCNGKCDNNKYYSGLDNKIVYESSISECGSDWPKDHFEMNGDQIFDIYFYKVGVFNHEVGILHACYYIDEICEPFSYKILESGKYSSHYTNKNDSCNYFFELTFKPIKSLEIEL